MSLARGLCQALAMSALVGSPIYGAQTPVPSRVFTTAPALAYSTPFSRIFDVAELADGRLIITDPTEAAVSLVSASGRTLVGRRGRGPREFDRPFSIIRLPGDTLAVYDAPNRRLFLIDGAGRPVGTRSIPMELLADGSLSPPKGADRLGRIYFDKLPPKVGDEPLPSGGAIIRWTPGQDRPERLTPVLLRDAQRRQVLRPFVARDGWDVAPDGTLLIVRAEDYHVEWLPPTGAPRRGPSVEVQAPALDDAEIDAYWRNQGSWPAGSATMAPAGAGATGSTEAARERLRSAWIFPERLPPFDADGVLAAPSGEAWVVRTKAWNAPSAMVDIFHRDGRRVATVALPPGRRLVAFGRTSVYLAHEDEDGLQWLERYAFPAE